MNRRKATLGVSVIGVVAGAVGLGLLAAPAGAGPAPSLPAISPQALVQSVLTAKPVALGGTVEVANNLGLPAVPGLPAQLAGGNSQIRVWTDGAGHRRISLPSTASETTYVDDGTTLYEWDSATKTVTENPEGAANAHPHKPTAADGDKMLNPATAAQQMVSTMQNTSNITVNGTASIAGRPAYTLALTPKPQEKTLLREVDVAVDAQTRMPLQFSVYGNGSSSPALQIGFSSVDFGPQDPSLFKFTVPPGATVQHGDSTGKQMGDATMQAAPKLVGSGWDTVLIANLPSGMGNSSSSSSSSSSSDQNGLHGSSSQSADPLALVQQFGTPVHGTWGHGWVISTSVGNALITSDGRLAAGFVPQQVLFQALGSGK